MVACPKTQHRSERARRPEAGDPRSWWSVRVVRALVFVLALPLMSAGALPLWAHLAGVEGPHVCHCAAEKHDCVCAKCNPEHEDRFSTESLQGRCGDDEIAFGGKLLLAVVPPPAILVPPGERTPLPRTSEVRVRPFARPPPTPPPRAAFSAT